jgi:hypothetical protein
MGELIGGSSITAMPLNGRSYTDLLALQPGVVPDRLFPANRLTRGWIVTGITRYHTGLPVTLNEQDDNSLLGTFSPGPTGSVVDVPNFTRGPLNFTDPRRQNLNTLTNPYFNTALFSPETVGQIGSSNRRFFHGPGNANWDFGFMKELSLTESKTMEFRAEFFNVFNHTNFNLPEGDITIPYSDLLLRPRILASGSWRLNSSFRDRKGPLCQNFL